MLAGENVNLTNCIITNNTPDRVFGEDYLGNNLLSVSYSNIQDGQEDIVIGENYSSIIWGEESNIDSDPLFCDPENGDFH